MTTRKQRDRVAGLLVAALVALLLASAILRAEQRHEYEAGATYVQIRHLSERQLIIEVEGYGVLHLRQVGC